MCERKNAIVTGSNRGIGKAIVTAFAEKGINVWAHARVPNDTFENEMKLLAEKNNVWIKPVYFDLTDTEAMKKTVGEIRKEKKNVDILVNNVGVAHVGLFQMTSVNEIRRIFEVNFFSMCELTQMISRLMVHQKKGAIINMSSISGEDIQTGNCAYGTSKAAVIALTKTLSAEFAAFGIRVNAVLPAMTDTDMAEWIKEKAGDSIVSETALKRLANPQEIANVVAFLASDEASFVTGQAIRVDGGM